MQTLQPDSYGRVITAEIGEATTIYYVHYDNQINFQVEFPNSTSIGNVYSTINAMAPVGYVSPGDDS